MKISLGILSLLFFLFPAVSISVVPPSPAGGEYLRIYAPGDYAYVPDHEDFDITSKKEGYTIEMWYYAERPLQEFDRAAVQPSESWPMIYKADSYEIMLGSNIIPRFNSETESLGIRGPQHPLSLNQWHYFVVTLSAEYVQVVYNNLLWGRRVSGFMALGNRDSLFCIGGGRNTCTF